MSLYVLQKLLHYDYFAVRQALICGLQLHPTLKLDIIQKLLYVHLEIE